jgi:CDP-paratose 2-epimerase
MSTNKVYGEEPNRLPLVELVRRWDLATGHSHYHGIDETMSIDQSRHTLYGVSKASADLAVQEYGRQFGMKTVVFRCGCVTGPAHVGVEKHGFLSHLMRCPAAGVAYTIHGYGGKQVRDNIHAEDLVAAIWAFVDRPLADKVYNLGGGRGSSCSVLEAIDLCEQIAGRLLSFTCEAAHRPGDHRWWISSTRSFESDYPAWRRRHDLRATLEEIHDAWR